MRSTFAITGMFAILSVLGIAETSLRALEPEWDAVTGSIDGIPLTVEHLGVYRPAWTVGGRRLLVDAAGVTVLADDGTGNSVAHPNWRSLTCLGGTEERAWIVGDVDATARVVQSDTAQAFEFAGNSWGPRFTVPATGGHRYTISAACRKSRMLIALSSYRPDPDDEQAAPARYQISCFDHDGKLLWNVDRASAGSRRQSDAGLLYAGRKPDYAHHMLASLTVIDESVLVCAGPQEDLVLLLAASGQELWSMPRIWEIRRGFTGPSVWSHHLGRYGLMALDEDDLNKSFEDSGYTKREYFEAHQAHVRKLRDAVQAQSASIVGGPLVLPRLRRGGEPGSSIFVAVALSGPESTTWEGYLSRCVVYELSAAGQPLAMLDMPRMLNGSHALQGRDELVWSCQGGQLACIAATPQDRFHLIGPGGPDMLATLRWYRDRPSFPAQGWLRTPAIQRRPFLHGKQAIYADGAWVETKGDTSMRIPLCVLDISSWRRRDAELVVPFAAAVRPPSTNYSSSGDTITTSGPHLVGLTAMRIQDGKLVVTIGATGRAHDYRLLGLP